MKTKLNFHEQLEKQSLSNRVSTLRSQFLSFVDNETINYALTQHYKIHPNTLEKDYRVVELSNKQKQDVIEQMKYFIKDIEACIAHLEG
jgi:hypothetical protein